MIQSRECPVWNAQSRKTPLVFETPNASVVERIVSAGKVCRKIGEKMRLSPAEQDEHVLIAIYARPSAGRASSSSYDSAAADDNGGGGGGGSGDLEGVAAEAMAASNGGGGGAGGADLRRGNSVEGGIAESRARRRESISNSRTGRCDRGGGRQGGMVSTHSLASLVASDN